jgi:hypothetical protein
VSADDLLETSRWIVKPTSSSGGATTASCSSAENLDGTSSTEGGKVSVSSMDDLSLYDETADFFKNKWTGHLTEFGGFTENSDVVNQVFSEEDEVANNNYFIVRNVEDLDSVTSKQNLDVTVSKDRLAVKQKGKRQSAAHQQKIAAATAKQCPSSVVDASHLTLPAITEDDTDDVATNDKGDSISEDHVTVCKSNSSRQVAAARQRSDRHETTTVQSTAEKTKVDGLPRIHLPVNNPLGVGSTRPIVSANLLAEAILRVGGGGRSPNHRNVAPTLSHPQLSTSSTPLGADLSTSHPKPPNSPRLKSTLPLSDLTSDMLRRSGRTQQQEPGIGGTSAVDVDEKRTAAGVGRPPQRPPRQPRPTTVVGSTPAAAAQEPDWLIKRRTRLNDDIK